jgi:hypothetical protein
MALYKYAVNPDDEGQWSFFACNFQVRETRAEV